MKILNYIVNGLFIIPAFLIVAGLNGTAGIASFYLGTLVTSTPTQAALVAGLLGIVYAHAIFYGLMPIIRRETLPLSKMCGWHLGHAIGFGAGPLLAAFLVGLGWFPWPNVVSALATGGLALIIVQCLVPLGIVGFPRAKFRT